MKIDIFDLSKLTKYKLIKGVVVHPLKVNRDPRGILVETLKKDWSDVYGKELPFSQNYFSITESNTARDENQWHLHATKQIDRFIVVQGQILVALYDWRKDSSTANLLNLFLMGEGEEDNGYYNLLVPKNVLHCFLVVSQKPAIILNFPTCLYDKNEEGRIDFTKVKFANGEFFSWNMIRKEFNLPLK